MGNSGVTASRLAFGCLCMGPLQQKLSPKDGGELIKYAYERGITLYDTAQYYSTYEHIGYAVRHGCSGLTLCTKSYAYERAQAKAAVTEALQKTGKDCIDIFMLHETETELTILGHHEAVEYYTELKRQGYIRAVGISTHFVGAVRAAALMPDIDVIEAIINKNGIGIVDGDRTDMENALKFAHEHGKGTLAMKPFGGGNIYKEAKSCLDYISQVEGLDSILAGMISIDEINANIGYFEGNADDRLFEKLSHRHKHIMIEDWCTGCGECVARCPNHALHLENGRSVCDAAKCLTCGYCSGGCEQMAIKIID